jgi:hypothetical protein
MEGEARLATLAYDTPLPAFFFHPVILFFCFFFFSLVNKQLAA